jgi:hypothetical protein
VGAAVILSSLIDMGALTLENNLSIVANPATASEHTASLRIDISRNEFKHVAVELNYPGLLRTGSGSNDTEKAAVKRLQEWLNLYGVVNPIDSDFGHSTQDQLKAFQAATNG